MDDADNFVFRGYYLEQTSFVAQPSSSSMPSFDPKFDLLVSTITQKKEDVEKMLKHLFISKLSNQPKMPSHGVIFLRRSAPSLR